MFMMKMLILIVRGRGNLINQKIAMGGKKNVKLVQMLGRSFSPRQAGMTCAVMNGLLSGSSLVPLHNAKEQDISDTSCFVRSSSSGTLIANLIYYLIL
jgi:hypothetical protein